MQILGDLIILDKSRSLNWLPLPWWHRAPLGLASDTVVYVSIVGRSPQSVSPSRPGEVIVSVLDPNKWPRTFLLECWKRDEPGVLSEILSTLRKHNVALAESVTLCDYTSEDGDSHHHGVTLVCENQGTDDTDVASGAAEAALEGIGWEIRRRENFGKMQLLWHDVGTVENGWIKNVKWYEQLTQRYNTFAPEFDFEKMVVSADTDRRYLRCVFPRLGARVVTVHHADVPDALHTLTARLKSKEVNLLSALLRRGGAKPHNAVLVAACEPSRTGGRIDAGEVRLVLEGIDQAFRVSDIRVSAGTDAKRSLYARHPEDFVVHIPEEIAPSVNSYREQLRKEHPKTHFVFLSRRLLSGVPEKYADRIKAVLRREGFEPLEGIRLPGVQKASFGLIADKLWNCDAGIVLFAVPRDSKKTSIENLEKSVVPNLAHELGFLHGHGKPVLILLEQGVRSQMGNFSNIQGLDAPTFPLFERSDPPTESEVEDTLKCIEEFVLEWITLWRKKGVFP